MKSFRLFLPLVFALSLGARPLAGQTTAPPSRVWRSVPQLLHSHGSAMAFAPLRQRIVRFGGGGLSPDQTSYTFFNRNDTWEWEGQRWVARQPSHRPPERSLHGMAYDPVSRRILLFGGSTGQKILGDTWAWDGRDWTRHDQSLSVAGKSTTLWRSGKVVNMVWYYHTSSNGIHEWDGKAWKSAAWKGPSSVIASDLVSDPITKKVFMLGPPVGTNDQSTWTFDETSWKKAGLWTNPKLLAWIIHDAARDEFLLLGDFEPKNPNMICYRVREGRFERIRPKTEVPNPVLFTALYHPGLKKIWLFSEYRQGGTPIFSTKLFVWDGTNWSLLPSKNAPKLLPGFFNLRSSVYDPVRDKVLLHLSDQNLWEWDLQKGFVKTNTTVPRLEDTGLAYGRGPGEVRPLGACEGFLLSAGPGDLGVGPFLLDKGQDPAATPGST